MRPQAGAAKPKMMFSDAVEQMEVGQTIGVEGPLRLPGVPKMMFSLVEVTEKGVRRLHVTLAGVHVGYLSGKRQEHGSRKFSWRYEQ
jgi:hypothetical protein